MTIQGAIVELQTLINADDVPHYYNGGIEKVIETIQMELSTTDIVTCEECRYKDNCMRCVDQWNFHDDGMVESSLSIRFCSEGERKDNE